MVVDRQPFTPCHWSSPPWRTELPVGSFYGFWLFICLTVGPPQTCVVPAVSALPLQLLVGGAPTYRCNVDICFAACCYCFEAQSARPPGPRTAGTPLPGYPAAGYSDARTRRRSLVLRDGATDGMAAPPPPLCRFQELNTGPFSPESDILSTTLRDELLKSKKLLKSKLLKSKFHCIYSRRLFSRRDFASFEIRTVKLRF